VRVTGHEKWGPAQLEEAVRWLQHGIELDDKPLRPAKARWLNDAQLQVMLTEGRHRQIRRMCEVIGVQVRALKRVRIGDVRLGALPVGYWRTVHSIMLPSRNEQTHSRSSPKRLGASPNNHDEAQIIRRVVIEPHGNGTA